MIGSIATPELTLFANSKKEMYGNNTRTISLA